MVNARLLLLLLLGQKAFQLAHRQRFEIVARRIRGPDDNGFGSGFGIDSGHAHIRALLHELDQDFAAAHAAFGVITCAQTSASLSTRSSINASSWNGVGVKRSRSVPRGTVGKLIGWT